MSVVELWLKGRDAREDNVLTVSVFGALATADRGLVLARALADLGVQVSPDEAERIACEGWRRYEGSNGAVREPAWVIESPNVLMFVEACLDGGFEFGQLWEDYQIGTKESTDFRLLCVSKDLAEPEAVARLRSEDGVDANRVQWRPWKYFHGLLERLLSQPALDAPSRRLLSSARALMEQRGLRGFLGISPEHLASMSQLWRPVRVALDEFASFVTDVWGACAPLGLVPLDKSFICPGQSQRIESPRAWMPLAYQFPIVDRDWPRLNKWVRSLFLRLYIAEGEMRAGYFTSLDKPPGHRADVARACAHLGGALKGVRDLLVAFVPKELPERAASFREDNATLVEPGELNGNLVRAAESARVMEIFRSWPLAQLDVAATVETLAAIRNVVDQQRLAPPTPSALSPQAARELTPA